MTGKAQAKKDAIISDLIEVRENILNAASSLSAQAQDEVFLGTWSVKDLLADLIGRDVTNLAAVQETLRSLMWHRSYPEPSGASRWSVA